jgi:GAF domain-containing protein
MPGDIKNIAIIGANKEGLRLLPTLLDDKTSRVSIIADSNRDAMLFKLNELGYRLADGLGITVTHNLDDVKKVEGLDIIVNALQDEATDRFLDAHEFRGIEKLGTLSTRLIWGIKASTVAEGGAAMGPERANEQTRLLVALREIVDVVRLTIDRKELLSVILKLANESTHAERGSIMLISEGTLRVEIAKGMDEEVVRKIRVPLGEGISGKVAVEGRPLLISGKARGKEFDRAMERSDVKSAMCVPLVVNGEVIGVINVSSSESTHVFTNEDLNFLTSLARLAAEVIQRSNEYERLRVDSAKFTFWKEVDGVMSSPQPLEKRLNVVAKRLVEIVPGLTCFIYIFDEERGRLFLRASSIRDSKGLGLLSLRVGEGIEGSAVESGQDVFLVDRTEEGKLRRVYLTLPMVSQGQVVGVMNGHVISTQGLSVYHESFLKDIRSLVAESVYKHRQREREKLRDRKMFAVDESGLEMISISDPKRLVTIIATTPAAILEAEGSLLRVKQAGAKRYQTAATYGLDDKGVREYFLPIEKEIVMQVLRKGEIVSREFSEEASPYIRSVISVPLKSGDEVEGVVTLFNKTSEFSFYPCGFSKSDQDILARFAVYAEKAMHNMSAPRKGAAMEPAAPVTAPATAREPGHSPQALFERRVESELNRARRYEKNLVLATVRISGLKDAPVEDRSSFEGKLVSSVRRRTRSFDIIVRLDEETFGFLFLDTSERIMRLMGAITDVIAADEPFHRALMEGRVEILYGHALFPRDGDSFAELYGKAARRVRLELNKQIEKD